ncbi:conjugative relaxase [Phragmitibacter flavus]|uniref:Conjugative relaxase n=1 Tax=Phragmitibacter flavus TaxID=2576071 RepID=A0A5R8KGU3_9BACT|nr:MobF family relaxase [Phragmitibacter flavus]TLD71467.1 conjugative relaxase [Phragmitibacter flavus]
MLRVVAHTSAAAARKYYAEGLKREDYYSEKQEIVGKWHGKAATLLGISGDVDKEHFAALVENRHPLTGEKLTPRTKDGRRVGYDLNFHAPKSLSVLYALTQDKEVLKAFRQAVADTMTELEERAETRVRKKGAQASRLTGNLAWAEFIHFTSRPVGGIPDPHLHAHCFTFNATFDQNEDRWKAAEFGAIKREAHYAEAAFHSRLAGALAAQGYEISRRKAGWEIKGMPASVIAKFSRRTAQIERMADEMGIKDAKAKDALGAATREGKRHGLTFSDLLAAWSVRLTDDEKAQISKVCYDKGHATVAKISAVEAVDYAMAKLFERQSVVERGHILAAALRFGAGDTSPQAIKAEFERRGLIGRKVGEEHLCTSVAVLAEEVALIGFVRTGRNSAMPLGGKGRLAISEKLSDEQRAAVKHLLTSRDQVMAIRGGAGVGKTTLMKDAVAAIEARGLKVFAFAPSAVASRETLREAGFAGADTVAHLMLNEKMQKQVQGQVIWVDEAGLLGVRDLWRIMEIAGPNTRVILTGDTAQHSPVARGDAFRLLQKHAGLRVAEVTEIRRQEIEDYKKAIEAISKGDLRTGFRRLEALGAFVEIEDEATRHKELAADYLALSKRGEPPLVVSPTHLESAKVTNAIREARRDAGQLGPERHVLQYQNLQWEEAERQLPENYRAGLVVQFHQNAKGIMRGAIFRVVGQGEDGSIQMQNRSGDVMTLPIKDAAKYLVYEERELALAKGDRIRITRNGESENGKRLNNGNVLTVEKFGKQGQIILSNGAVLDANHGHIAHGYCQTSHSSQSKSVQDVLIAQSADSFKAASREQFYVSCSRGKQTVRIYTDNRSDLQQAVGNSSTRMSGVELAELTSKDLSGFMSSEMGAKQWRDAIKSRRGLDGSKTFVEQLVEQRKTDPTLKKEEGISWKGYIEMRRNLVGADGKNRSKGHPAGQQKAGAAKGKTTPKRSEHSEARVAELKAAQEAKKSQTPPKKETPKGRLVKAYESAASHFKKVADKVRGSAKQKAEKKEVRMGKTTAKPLQENNAGRAADHTARAKTAKAGKEKAKAAQQQKAQSRKAPVQTPKK